jgi:hypothetical protein
MHLQSEIDSGYLFTNWSVANFNSGTYEIVLHSVCSTLGSPTPGIDDAWSRTIVGTVKLVDTFIDVISSSPANFATGYVGEDMYLTFSTDLNCDMTSGKYWFDVTVSIDGTSAPFTFFIVYCEGAILFVKPTGDGVRWCLFLNFQS